MKHILAIIVTSLALVSVASAQTTASPAPHKSDMKLAKKAEHKKSPSAGEQKADTKAKATKK
jgi:hypothetical protein